MCNNASVAVLRDAVSTYDRESVDRTCDELVAQIAASAGAFCEKDAKEILKLLRRKRFFPEMKRVADALIQAGSRSANIRRQYAQALIESGEFGAAILVLEQLIADSASDDPELGEAKGLVGRALKQQYVNHPGSGPAQAKVLARAITAYHDVYRSGPKDYLWHGINAAALAKRAARDGIALPAPIDADQIAADLLQTIGRKPPDSLGAFEIATAAEACLALGRIGDALEWLRQYVIADGTDAFEVGSTLRQLREVWGLTSTGPGSELVTVLEAALLSREGGAVTVSAEDLGATRQPNRAHEGAFELVFGDDGPVKYAWYMMGANRARSVGRVENAAGQGQGSGFLIRGRDLFPWITNDELLFVTNAHVIGRTFAGALAPERAEVRFEAFDPGHSYKVTALLWESPVNALDAAVVRLEAIPEGLAAFPLGSSGEPTFVAGIKRRFFIIGYPQGGALSISLNDNLQVGWARPLLHYRTPTEPGNSGSPVMDEEWCLVAVHHKGKKTMPRPDGRGFYEANEGIWIQDVVAATLAFPMPPGFATAPAPITRSLESAAAPTQPPATSPDPSTTGSTS
jgi:tetratricopeptide (TPR) repeat protein